MQCAPQLRVNDCAEYDGRKTGVSDFVDLYDERLDLVLPRLFQSFRAEAAGDPRAAVAKLDSFAAVVDDGGWAG